MPKNDEPNFTKASAAATKLLKRYGIFDPREIELEDIAMAQGVLVLEDPLGGAEARLVRRTQSVVPEGAVGGLIRVNAAVSEPGRRRFALAHELGHWFLHGDTTQVSVCTGTQIHAYSGSTEELEANAFAGQLLMPTRFMRETYTEVPSLGLVKTAALDLGTTLTATAVRLVETARDWCFVVFSDANSGRVRWWRRSRSCPKIWLEKKQRLTSGTCAKEVSESELGATAGPEEVQAKAWFGHVSGHDRFLMSEDSMRLGGYPVVMSVLVLGER